MATHKVIHYADADNNTFEGNLYIPSSIVVGQKLPAVIVFPAFRGITQFEQSEGRKIAEKHGYIAFVADVYGKGIRPTKFEDARATMMPLVSDRMGKLRSRLILALETVKCFDIVDKTKISTLGYCFGGLCALDMARHRLGLKAAVSFHGTLTPIPDLELKEVETSIQVHHGDADTHISKEQIDGFFEEMRTRNADFVFAAHSHAKHAFTEPDADSFNMPGVGYSERTARRSWEAAIDLFVEVFSS